MLEDDDEQIGSSESNDFKHIKSILKKKGAPKTAVLAKQASADKSATADSKNVTIKNNGVYS